jgi:hypothetical protein
VKPRSAGSPRAAALTAAVALAVGLLLGFSLGRLYARSAASGTDSLEREAPAASIGRAFSPSPSSPEASLPSGSSTEEGSPAIAVSPSGGEAHAGTDADAVLTLTERLARLGPGQGANPTREIIEVGPLLLMLEEDQLPDALTVLQNLRASPSLKAMLISTLFLRWTELDPAAALERAETIADPQTRNTAWPGTT